MAIGSGNGIGDEVLDNKVRRLIFNHIAEYPGVSFNKLKTIFELSDSSLRYHLHYLEKNGQISSSPENGVRCYFPHPTSVSIPKPQEPLASYQLTPNQKHILNMIIRYPGINQKELVKRTGLNRFKISRSISSLKDMDLIKNNRYQNNVCYEYNPDVEMKYKIMKGLMVKFLKGEIDEGTFLKLKKRLD
jgi:predicted transcriptional regulator